jgi:metal-dependent HD superfamily phosphatase/phosphodiesterase
MVRDYGLRREDAEVVVVLGCLFHCVGMAVHRRGHEDWSLFMAADRLPGLLEGLYEEPERTIVIAEVLQTITAHRADGEPLSLEAGIVRVADALDMAKGRSRIPFSRAASRSTRCRRPPSSA